MQKNSADASNYKQLFVESPVYTRIIISTTVLSSLQQTEVINMMNLLYMITLICKLVSARSSQT